MPVPEWMPQWAKPETRRSRVLLIATAVLLFIGLSAFSLFSESETPKFGWIGTYDPDWHLDVEGENGAVASDSAHCSQMGVNVLKQGGSAADAAVQVGLCIGTMVPQSAGIGGGGFITVRFPNGSSIVIDARETAPAKAHKHMYDKDPMASKFFGLASGVPGELAGLEKLWQLGGRLPWKELVEPVAELNDIGFTRGESLQNIAETFFQRASEQLPGHRDNMLETSDWCWLLSDHPKCGNRKESASDHIRRPQLAQTLRQIAVEGADALYHGSIGRSLVEITQKTGGIMTIEDVANYSVVVRPAITTTFLNHTVITAPEPASGPALVMGLNAIAKLLPESTSRELDQDPVMLHRIVEVMKWMAAARSELGDPAYISNPRIRDIPSDTWAQQVANNVSDSHTLADWRDYHPSYEMNNPAGTTHFSVLDKDGMAVSMTSTVNLPFGNSVCDPVTGVILNSEMDDFSIPRHKNSFELMPSIYNFVQPGKRPLSSAVPAVLVSPKGSVDLVIGAAGGSRILTTVFQAIVRLYGFDLEGLEASAFPRFHHQLLPEALAIEPGYSAELVSEWESRGHIVEQQAPGSAMNLIHRDHHDFLHAIGEFYRKRGLGAAY